MPFLPTFSELFGPHGRSGSPWVALMSTAKELGQDELVRRAGALNRQINLALPINQQAERIYDPLPAVLTAAEFSVIEEGLKQRASVLSTILEDLYGQQTLLHQGKIPPALILGNSHFLRSMHTKLPLPSQRLSLYAADITRTQDGQFHLLRDHTDIIPGLGNALSLRKLTSGILPEFFRSNLLRSVRPAQEMLVDHLQRCAQGQLVAVLSAGTGKSKASNDLSCYDAYDDALLARALGLLMVEPADLAARNGSLHIKTLSGLLPVSSLIRRISALNLDPLEQGGHPSAGVAGSFGAIRSGALTMLNEPGSALLESPSLYPFLPQLFEDFIGASPDLLGIDAQAKSQSSTAPFLEKSGTLVGAPLYFRLFAWHDGKEWQVLPGGLGLPLGPAEETLGRGIKDLWILDREEPRMTNGIRLSEPPEKIKFLAAAHLPSRLADNLFWLGRSVERLEAAVRILMLAIPRLESGTSLPRDLAERALLSRCLVQAGLLPNDVAGSNISGRMLRQTLAQREPITALLKEVERLVDASAERLSSSMLATVRFALRQALEIPVGDEPSLPGLLGFTATFAGIASENMSRDGGWLFLEMGRRLERGETLANMFSVLLDGPTERLGPGMALAVELADSVLSYELRYSGILAPGPVLAMLLTDHLNPRTLAFQCQALRICLERLGAENDAQTVKKMQKELTQLASNGCELNKTLSAMVASLRGLSARVQQRFFTLLPEAHALEDNTLLDFVQ